MDVMPSKLPRVVVYMPTEVRNKLEVLAEMNERSVSAYMLHLAEKAIWEAERSGQLPTETSQGAKS
jgi:hypothetical protein